MQEGLSLHSIWLGSAEEPNEESRSALPLDRLGCVDAIVHSVKGMDYSCVYLLGLDCLEEKDWNEQQINNLVYVAVTRARYQLFIPYIQENAIIRTLKRCL